MSALAAQKIQIFEYEDNLNTEQAIFLAANDTRIQELLEYIRNERGAESVNTSIHSAIDGLDATTVAQSFSTWVGVSSLNADEIRQILIDIALRQKWFKNSRISREIAPTVWSIINDDSNQPISKLIKEIEVWLYA